MSGLRGGGGAASRGNPRPTVMAGMVVIILFFGCFGVWSALAPLARGAYAIGNVASEGKRRTVQHLEGGIVGEILVAEGSHVDAGDLLVRLERTQAAASFDLLNARRDRTLAEEARLLAERDDQAEIEFPDELLSRRDQPRVRAVMNDQQSLFRARRIEIKSQVEILEQKIIQLDRQIEGMRAEQKANLEQSRLIKDELEGVRSLHAKGYAPLTRLRALERAASALEGENGARTAEIARAQVAIGETRMQIIQTSQQVRREVIDQLRDARSRLSDLDEQVSAARDVLSRTEITAPISGQVLNLAVHTIGGVIPPGGRVLDLVPDKDRLIVEARVKPTDAELVHAGLHARVRFPGLPRRTAPLIHGEVETFSADAIEDPTLKMPFFLARIAVSDEQMALLREFNLTAGMPAEVLIETGNRTVLGYLVAPWKDLFEKAMRED